MPAKEEKTERCGEQENTERRGEWSRQWIRWISRHSDRAERQEERDDGLNGRKRHVVRREEARSAELSL